MPKPASGLVKTNFMCDPQVLDALRWLSQSRKTSVSELIRLALKKYVVDELRKEQEIIQVLSAIPEAADG